MVFPRFRLSSLVLLMIVAAVCCAWWRDHRRLTEELAQYRQGSQGTWSVAEATGPPNTWRGGDIPTAWASATPDGQAEWLMLEFAKAMVPRSLVIHETFNPGAVCKVTAFTASGEEVTVWQGNDPVSVANGWGVAVIPLDIDFKTSRVRIHLDSPRVPGWNEIDAVGLRSVWGFTTWAERATASSSYGDRFSSFGYRASMGPMYGRVPLGN